MLKQAEQYQGTDVQSRPWCVESVSRSSDLESRIQRKFLLLTSYDFEKAFGRPPRARDPKAATVTLPDLDGTPTQFFAFLDPSMPFRTLEVSSGVAEHRVEELMASADHCHERQAELMQSSRSSKRQAATGVAALLGNQQWALCTMSEYQARLGGARDLKQRINREIRRGGTRESTEKQRNQTLKRLKTKLVMEMLESAQASNNT